MRIENRQFATASPLLATMLTVVAGCAGPRAFQPAVDPAALDQARFVHYLATIPVATVDEAGRAVLILADGQESPMTPEERLAELENRGIVRPAWGLEPGHTIDRSTLGYMLFRTCRMPGGVNTLLLGSWGLGDRRYALKEVVAAGILAHGPEYEPVTGGELVAALARADTWLADHGRYESGEHRIDSLADVGASVPGS